MNGNDWNQPGGGTWRYRASTREGEKQYMWVGDLGVTTRGVCQMTVKEKCCPDTVALGKPISERSGTEAKAPGRSREREGQAEAGNGVGLLNSGSGRGAPSKVRATGLEGQHKERLWTTAKGNGRAAASPETQKGST